MNLSFDVSDGAFHFALSISLTFLGIALFCFENVKRIISRLIVFDNEEYISKGQSSDISDHRNYIQAILKDNDNILREYQNMLLAISRTGEVHQTDMIEIQATTEALNIVLGGKQFASLEKKYFETYNIKED